MQRYNLEKPKPSRANVIDVESDITQSISPVDMTNASALTH